jgi:DNA-binding CsgD family transcriptional regulator
MRPMSEHAYRSTACYHERHDDCRLTCKFCTQPCNCPCHTRKGPQKHDPLTDREREILTLVADGLSNPQIGDKLGVSPLTVKQHLARMAIKLDTGQRAEMVAVGFRRGVLN